jgi:hypothetical protein
VFSRIGIKPVLTSPTVFIVWCLSLCGIPVGAFPAIGFSKAGSPGSKALMENRGAYGTGALKLAKGPVVGIEESQGLNSSVTQVEGVPWREYAGNIDIQVSIEA